jgi:hypothetical protein
MKTTDVFQGYPRKKKEKNQFFTFLDDDDSTIGASSMEINSLVEGIKSVQSDKMELNSVVSSSNSILSCVAPPPAQFNNQQATQDQALFDNFSVGPATALFDNFQIIPNPYSQYWRWCSLYENVNITYNGVTTNASGRQHCVFVLLDNTIYS